MPATRFVVLFVLAWQLVSGVASALTIEDARWGFNGKVAVNRFNLLSVLVNNPTPQPYDAPLILRKSLGGAGFVDAEIVEAVTVAPFASKWVQFYPYINGVYGNNLSNENWHVSYGRETYDVPVPHPAKYQRVILDDPAGLAGRSGILKRMPENLFPSFVSATDALQVLALDHEPRSWIPTQKQACLDWVRLGGTVVLFHGATKRFPEFTGPLAALNSPLDDFRYGAGRVMKIGIQRTQFDENEARRAFEFLPKNYLGPTEKAEDPIDVVDPAMQAQINSGNMYGEGNDPFVSSSFMNQLREMTKPEHNWLLLHFMFWVYIAMVFPGCYILGKRWSDFRVVYAGLLGTVTLFSLLFSIVGQRGYGEATAVHTVAIARCLSDGGMDVSSWSNVFVTSGAKYMIKHNGTGSLYSTCSETERVLGAINNGVDGSFYVDIPPFSNREFALRVRLPAGSPKVSVENIKLEGGRLQEMLLNVEGVKLEDVLFSSALYGDRFYSLNAGGGKLKLGGDTGDASSMLRLQTMHEWTRSRYPYGYGAEAHQTPKQRFNEMYTPLLSRALNVSRESEARQVRLPLEMVRVFIYTRLSPDFAVQNKNLGGQDGYVLYCVDLPTRE